MISYRDIAKHSGLSPMTISRVMRGAGNVTNETRDRVIKSAKALGYQRNPTVDSFMKLVRAKKIQANTHKIAWIYPDPNIARYNRTVYNLYKHGAEISAETLGFSIDSFTVGEGLKPSRLRQILKTRGINCLILNPAVKSGVDFPFDFTDFAAVSLGYTISSPNLNRVTSHHTNNQYRLLGTLRSKGYRDIIYSTSHIREERINNGWLSATIIFKQKFSNDTRLRIFFGSELEEFINKSPKSEYPEVIVSDSLKEIKNLNAHGISVPNDVGFATPTVELAKDFGLNVSGIDQSSCSIGARAVEFLADLLTMNRIGIPDNPLCLMVEGKWHEGETL